MQTLAQQTLAQPLTAKDVSLTAVAVVVTVLILIAEVTNLITGGLRGVVERASAPRAVRSPIALGLFPRSNTQR